MQNHYINLLAQAEKLFRHNRQGGYKTKIRYFDAFKRFLRFTADEYHLEKLANLSGKHMEAYFVHLREKGTAASTIKTDASAIRFWHDQIPNSKYKLPTNEDLNLEKRRFGGVDRRWSDREFNLMIAECWNAKRDDFEACIVIARYAGLRIHEVMRIDTAIARAALKNGYIRIKGKGGKIRDIPINDTIRIEFKKFLKLTPPGQKLFVPKMKTTHSVITELEKFILKNRKNVQPPDSDQNFPITFHGLRHTYATEQYLALLAQNHSESDAKKKVSELLGHNRPNIVSLYLAGVENSSESGAGGDGNV